MRDRTILFFKPLVLLKADEQQAKKMKGIMTEQSINLGLRCNVHEVQLKPKFLPQLVRSISDFLLAVTVIWCSNS